MIRPLDGVRVIDFSTLLPGPLATLMMAEAGAVVIKVERPGDGDAMRRETSDFALLNHGKRSVVVDVKDSVARDDLLDLIAGADVLVEQFRPGVMDRLGLGWDVLSAKFPQLIYCSITGYGQTGPAAQRAGHDLTYAAETGMLGQTRGADGSPVMPHAPTADITGGSYPALINILLALRQRETTGRGVYLDIAMYDNVFPLLYPAWASAFGRGRWPVAGDAIETGASPRYRLYPTADGRWVAVAAVEEKFWRTFCAAIALPFELIDSSDAAAVIAGVSAAIGARTSAHWNAVFADDDCASALVRSFEEATRDPHFQARGLAQRLVAPGLPTLPLAVVPLFVEPAVGCAPDLGQDQAMLQTGWPT